MKKEKEEMKLFSEIHSYHLRSGLSPITTCSPRNFELVQSYGATAVFDYHQETCADDIRKYTRNSLKFVLDCISEPETMKFCYKCIGRSGGKYTAMEPFPEFLHTRPNTVVPSWVLGPMVLGKRLDWPEPFGREENEEYRKFGFEWYGLVQELLNGGKLKTHPIKIIGDRLGDALGGLELLRERKVSGQKLICRV